jgi:hypothetical protein
MRIAGRLPNFNVAEIVWNATGLALSLAQKMKSVKDLRSTRRRASA